MLNYLFNQTPLLFLTQSFWRDEAFSYMLAKRDIVDIIILSAKDFTPPLYQLVIHFWLKIFGGSEISLRSFSLIFFCAMLYICFLFLENIFKLNSKKCLVYILLFAVNPFLLYYAFEARTYSFFAFLSAWSYYAFYKKDRKTYLIATVLGLYTHYFMVFVVASQFVFNLIRNKNKLQTDTKKIIYKCLLFFAPWVLFVFLNKNIATSFWIAPTNQHTFIRLLGTMFTGFESNVTWTSLFLLFIISIALFKIKLSRHKHNLDLFILLMIWGVGIPFFVALISLLKPIYFPRYLVFAPVGLTLLLVYCLEHVRYKARILLFVLLLSISIHYQKMSLEKRKKTDFRKTALEILPLAKNDDQIFVTSELNFFTAQYYFPNNKVYIFNKTYEEIPDFTGKVLIFPNDLASSLPFYPKKAFVIKSNGDYEIQALY